MKGAIAEVGKDTGESEPRFLSHSGDIVHIFVFFMGEEGQDASVTHIESPRQTRLEADLTTLVKLVLEGKIPKEGVRVIRAKERLKHESFSLVREHANLVVGASPPAPKVEASDDVAVSSSQVAVSLKRDTSPADGTGATPVQQNTASVTIQTGPREHWFLSANVNVRRFSELKFDETTKMLVPKEQAPPFLIGFNFFTGDLASERSNGLSGLYVGVAMEPSRRPGNAVAAVAGLRLQRVKWLGVELSTLSPYVGYLRTTADTLSDQGHEAKASWRWVYGISLNLDKAAAWLK